MNAIISPFDPLDRLEPGEDRFVLRENDRAAPAAISAWCHARRNIAYKLYAEDERALTAELLQCNEAEAKALDWKERQVNGASLEEVAQRATYISVVLTEEQVKAAARQRDMVEARRHLREAAYHLNSVIEADGEEDGCMVMLLTEINGAADMLDEVPA